MTNVRTYTNLQIILRVESLPSFKGWKKGVYDIMVRSNEDEYNKFDDKFYKYECEEDGKRPKFIFLHSGTTNPGSQGLKKFETYNKLGCAVAVADHICYESHIYGPHGKTKYPAYIQRYSGEQYPYTRDNDRDEESENYGKIYTDRIGMNSHKAGEASVDINGNSTACFVRNNRKQYDEHMKFMKKRPLSTCVLNEWEPEEK